MKTSLLSVAAMVVAASPVFADGHLAAGENDFKKCRACHTIASDSEVFFKGGRTGPNLYGVVGRTAGSTDFKYSDAMIAAGEAGLVWTEADIAAFIADPTAFLRQATGDDSAKSKMTFKLKGGENVAAYLASFSKDMGMDMDMDMDMDNGMEMNSDSSN